jgi:hypothetical protein
MEEQAQQAGYFDLAAFAEAEQARLEDLDYRYRKTVNINGEEETQEVEEVTILDELAFLKSNNINRPAMVGRYKVDSTRNTQGQLTSISHKALDEKLALQFLLIEFNSTEQVVHIELQSQTSSRLLKTFSKAIYEPAKGYQLENQQKITFFGEQDMRIQLEYLER